MHAQFKDNRSRGVFFLLSDGPTTMRTGPRHRLGQLHGPDPPDNHHEMCGQNEAVVFVAEWFSDFSICSHSLVLWAVNMSTFLVTCNSDVLSDPC